MKKVISVLLAVIMMFSTLAVGFMAFAEDAEPTSEESILDDETVKEALDTAFIFFLGMKYDEFMALDGDAQWEAIQNMDMNKLMVLAHVAKIVLKLVKVAIKLANLLDKFGILDLSEYKQMIVDFVAGAIEGADIPSLIPATD